MNSRTIRNRIVALALTVVLVLTMGQGAFAEICMDATVLPQNPSELKVSAVLGDTALELTFPNGESGGYLLAYSDIPAILAEFLGLDGTEMPAPPEDAVLRDLALRYGKIFIGIANVLNLSRKKMDYELSAFGTAPRSTVWTCSPSRRDWSKMLTKLFQTASTDEQLAAVLPDGAPLLFSAALDRLEEILDLLDGVSVQAAYDDGNIYALRLFNAQQGISYQSWGSLSSVQHDAIVYEKGESRQTLAISETTAASRGFTGNSRQIRSREDMLEAVSQVLKLVNG